MLDHHLQREIHFRLSRTEALRFSELQPEGVENKLFDYHLKKTLRSGLVQKNADGTYSLTPTGRRIGPTTAANPKLSADKAYSLLLLGVQREDGAWLLYKRSSLPQIDRSGFVQVKPSSARGALEVANEFLAELGLHATLSVHGHGYLRALDASGAVESFIHFTLLKGAVQTCTATPLPENYFWAHVAEFSDHHMLPSTDILLELLTGPAGTFVDETYSVG